MTYQILGHTADVRLSVRARTKEKLFCEAARGTAHLQKASFRRTGGGKTKTLFLSAPDCDILLVSFLNEIIAFSDMHHAIPVHCIISFPSPAALRASLRFAPVAKFDTLIKAATYHGVRIQRKGAYFVVTILFDI